MARTGICKLTGANAPFAKAHIIPLALTRPTAQGAPLLESTKGRGFRRRWSSWYDTELVSHPGEKILSRIDDAGIKELRRNQLVWSSWILFKPHFEIASVMTPHWSFRNLRNVDFAKLFLFFVSIAWRAASSNRPEMCEVSYDADVVEDMRAMITGEKPADPRRFPISLTQLTSVGAVHNHSPYNDKKILPAIDGGTGAEVDITRIYIDGLVCHLHWYPGPAEDYQGNQLFIGCAKELLISGIEYSASFQRENCDVLAFESTFGPIGNFKWTE